MEATARIFQNFYSNIRKMTFYILVRILSIRALGVEVYLHSFLTSALDRGELSASQPRPLYPWGNISHYPQNAGIEGPKKGLVKVKQSRYRPGVAQRVTAS